MASTRYTTSGVNSEGMVEIYPPNYQPNGKSLGIIFSHGFAGNALECAQPNLPEANLFKVINALANAGFVLLGGDFGGNHWGAPASTTKITAAVNYLQTTMGARTDKIGFYAQSMGHLGAMNWVAASSANKAKTAFVISSIGVADLANINAQSTYTSSITAAYGAAYSDTNNGATSNPSVNTTTKYTGLNWLGWYGTSDTVCPPARTQALAANIGSTAQLMPMSGGTHSWESISLVDPATTVAWAQSKS